MMQEPNATLAAWLRTTRTEVFYSNGEHAALKTTQKHYKL